MASWAIVVGIDAYWREQASLRGAVRDALRVREWLIDPAGGDVPDTNVFALLGVQPGITVPDVGQLPPTKDNIVRVIHRLLQTAAAGG